MVAVAPSPRVDYPVAYRFSNHFGINKPQSELDFVDVFVDTDLRIYIDPYALKIEEDDWSVECSDLVVGFFQELVDSMRTGQAGRSEELLGNLHEPNETRLGQSFGKPQGRGVGHLQAGSLHDAFAKSKAVETGVLSDLSDCELFIDGISHDKISDITTNIIRRKLVEFTKEQCRRWGVPLTLKPTGPWWHAESRGWRSTFDLLPVYEGYPIILVPKRAVRYKMAIDDREYYNTKIVEFIRQEFNKAESVRPGASLYKLLRAGMKVSKKDVAKEIPKTKDLLREFSEKFPELLRRYKLEAKDKARNGRHKPTDHELFETLKGTAHDHNLYLVEEIHMHFNNVGGDNFGSVGQGNRVVIKDVTVYKSDVDAAQTIGFQTKELLKQAADEIETARIPAEDKDDAKENLQKLTEELASGKRPNIIVRCLDRLAQVAPAVATILKSGGEIAQIVQDFPSSFAG